MATGIWVRLMKKSHISRDMVAPCGLDDWQDALEKACHDLDVPRPMLLPRHERDWEEFSQVRFLPDHFVESVDFDRMEVEFIDPDRKHETNPQYL